MFRMLVLAWLLPSVLLAQEPPPPGVLLLHSPPHAVLNDRPYIVDFIVQFEPPRRGPVHYDTFDLDSTARPDTASSDTILTDPMPVDSVIVDTTDIPDSTILDTSLGKSLVFANPMMKLLPVDSADIAKAIAIDFDFVGPVIESVSLFYRTNASLTYQEVPMDGSYNRYKAAIPKVYLSADTLTYFFSVTTEHFRIWGYPTAPSGELQPIVRLLVPPSQEYFQREARGYP